MATLSFQWHFVPVLLLLVFGVLHRQSCHAIRLNPDGGYDIVIGVEPNTVEPMNTQVFLNEIRDGVNKFSEQLWKTTHKRFYINSADILVPANWWTISNFNTTSWQHLLGSEIRLAHDVAAPNVVNPNPCGSSGLYMELPDTFFKTSSIGHADYGSVAKSLVSLWARYRFGVWEEHGIPGDTKFPYFYTPPSFEPRWEATGCSNEELTGSFKTVDGEESDRCDPLSVNGPDDDCRFFPADSNTANSSMLHFHWLESVTEFCDSKTHNHVAPNRHNLFCGHKSAWEVIRESDDYKSTKRCTETFTPPQFRVMKPTNYPEFYILLDRGRTITPEKVLQEVMGAIVQFVSFPTLERINVAVGTYPHTNQGKDHSYVKREVGWGPINSVLYNIESVLADSADPNGPEVRDFGLAIQEAAEEIKQRNHAPGSVLFVIKRGAGPNDFDTLAYEQEVIASIKEDNRIHVFVIETQQGEQTPYTNLQSLVSATSGYYHLINDTMNTAKKLEGFLENMQYILEQPSIMPMNAAASWVTQKQYTQPNEVIEIPIHDRVPVVRIHLTTNKNMRASEIQLEDLSGELITPDPIEKGEWDENSDLSRRLVFTYVIRNPKQGSTWTLKHGCLSEKSSDCQFFLLVSADLFATTPRALTFSGQSITIDVSTSAEHNYVDMSSQGLRVAPFSVFAKIELNQQRILGLENVTAFIRLGGDTSKSWLVPLADDGRGLPDVSSYDGIYSGVFTPLEDGLYQISVAASGQSGDGNFQDIRIVNHAGTLMPRDQINFGCKNSTKPRCVSGVPTGSFSRVQDMAQTIFVENAASFKPGKPMKIMDFVVTTLPNFSVKFDFTSPKLFGSEDSPDEYNIYMAPHVDNFLESTELTKILISQVGDPPGTHVTINYNAVQKAIPYYAVEAVYSGQKGGPSNVVGVALSASGSLFPTTTGSPTSTSSELTDDIERTTEPPTTTTEYPWPTTTGIPFSSTTEESDESGDDDLTTESPPTSTTIITDIASEIWSFFSSSSTTPFPEMTSTTEDQPMSTTLQSIISSSTTTPPQSEAAGSQESSTSTNETPETTTVNDSSLLPFTSTGVPYTTEAEPESLIAFIPSPSSSTTLPPDFLSAITTDDTDSSTTSSTTQASGIISSTGESDFLAWSSSSTTQSPEITSIIGETEMSPNFISWISSSTTQPPEIVSTTISESEMTTGISSAFNSWLSSSSTTESPEILSEIPVAELVAPLSASSTTESPELLSNIPLMALVAPRSSSTTETPELLSGIPVMALVAPLSSSTTQPPETSSVLITEESEPITMSLISWIGSTSTTPNPETVSIASDLELYSTTFASSLSSSTTTQIPEIVAAPDESESSIEESESTLIALISPSGSSSTTQSPNIPVTSDEDDSSSTTTMSSIIVEDIESASTSSTTAPSTTLYSEVTSTETTFVTTDTPLTSTGTTMSKIESNELTEPPTFTTESSIITTEEEITSSTTTRESEESSSMTSTTAPLLHVSASSEVSSTTTEGESILSTSEGPITSTEGSSTQQSTSSMEIGILSASTTEQVLSSTEGEGDSHSSTTQQPIIASAEGEESSSTTSTTEQVLHSLGESEASGTSSTTEQSAATTEGESNISTSEQTVPSTTDAEESSSASTTEDDQSSTTIVADMSSTEGAASSSTSSTTEQVLITKIELEQSGASIESTNEEVAVPPENESSKEEVAVPPEIETSKEEVAVPPEIETSKEEVAVPPEIETSKEEVAVPPENESSKEEVAVPPENESSKEEVAAPPEIESSKEEVATPPEPEIAPPSDSIDDPINETTGDSASDANPESPQLPPVQSGDADESDSGDAPPVSPVVGSTMSASIKIMSSESLLVVLTLSSIYFQTLFTTFG